MCDQRVAQVGRGEWWGSDSLWWPPEQGERKLGGAVQAAGVNARFLREYRVGTARQPTMRAETEGKAATELKLGEKVGKEMLGRANDRACQHSVW